MYSGGPYVSVGTIDSYGSIGPLNIPYSRVNEVLQDIIDKMITAGYVPWEWWFSYSGELNVKSQRGTDKSVTVEFLAGIHIGGATKETSSKQTAQRVRVVGRGESEAQDENTSDWHSDTTEMANVNSFYERIVSDKSISIKDEADIWSRVILAQDAPMKSEYTIRLENNPYTVGDFDVGDTVTVTDVDVGFSGKYRIMTIEKTVSGFGGEVTIVTVSNKRTDITDRLSDLFKRLERLEHSSTYLDVMFAEGSRQNKLNANEVEDVWEQTASNKWATELPEDEAFDVHLIQCDYPPQPLIDFECDKDVFRVWSTAADAQGVVYLEDPFLKFSRDPRFTCEFELDTGGTGTTWKTGDYIGIQIAQYDAGFTCNVGEKGFGFYIYAPSDDVYELRAWIKDDVDYHMIKIANIALNVKYTIEARMQWKERVVLFYFGKTDVAEGDPDWLIYGFKLRGILPVSMHSDDVDNLFPFEVILAATVTTIQDLYIYRWKTQAIRAVES